MTSKKEPKKNTPFWAFGPNGEKKIFQNRADKPKGWKDSPAAFIKKTSKAK